MANPTTRILKDSTQFAFSGEMATLKGAISKSIGLSLVTIVAAALAGYFLGNSGTGFLLMFASMIIAFILSLVICFKPNLAPTLAPGYAVFEGAALGIISAQFERYYAGISAVAVGITLITLFVMLFLWKSQVIKVTEKVQSIIISMTGAVFVFYLIGFIASIFGFHLIPSSGIFALIISVVIAGVAAFNLILDFETIQRSVSMGTPKYMEDFCAVNLLITLVWLYIEILRILSIIMEMMNSKD